MKRGDRKAVSGCGKTRNSVWQTGHKTHFRTPLFASQGPYVARSGRFWPRGVQEKKKWNGGISGRWPINQVGRYLSGFFFLIFEIFFMAFLCVSQQGEFKNTIKNFLGKIYVKNFWPKKLRKKNFFPFVFSHRLFFYRVFGRFSAWGAQKHHKNIF